MCVAPTPIIGDDMKLRILAAISLAGSLVTVQVAQAHGGEVVAGTLFGAGAGALLGQAIAGNQGAVVGGAIGAVAGTAIAANQGRVYTSYPYPAAPAVTYYPNAPVYNGDPVVYGNAQVYYTPPPPPVVYAPRPVYAAPYYPPAPVYAPARVYYSPPAYYGGHHHRHHHRSHRDWR